MPENKNKTGRNNKGQFNKGVSGNPGGRPKKPADLEKYGIEAFKRVADMAKNSENEKIRFDANKWLCEMAFGKPTQATEIEGSLETGPTIIEFTGALDEWSK
jgi:hypothetical protein